MNDDIKWCAHKDGLAVKGTISNLEDQLFCDIGMKYYFSSSGNAMLFL